MSLESIALFSATQRLGVPLIRRRQEIITHIVEAWDALPSPPDVDPDDLRQIRVSIGCVLKAVLGASALNADGWFWKPAEGWDKLNPLAGSTLCAIEIEDSSKMTQAKLEKYAWLWFVADCEGMILQCHCFDRYGIDHAVLDDRYLQDVYYQNILGFNGERQRGGGWDDTESSFAIGRSIKARPRRTR